MSDLKPFVHGEEGTHWACPAQLRKMGGKTPCCECTNHKCKDKEVFKLAKELSKEIQQYGEPIDFYMAEKIATYILKHYQPTTRRRRRR